MGQERQFGGMEVVLGWGRECEGGKKGNELESVGVEMAVGKPVGKKKNNPVLGVCGRMWHQQSYCDCACWGNHIKAPESVNPNGLQRSSCSGTLSPVTVLFQPIDLFSQ